MTTIIDRSAKKYAVLVGINYTGTQSALNGCINDTDNLKVVLTDKFGYLPEDILVLTDDSETKPTKQNILNAFDTLVNKATNEGYTELWFSYSGHGSYMYDTNNDETDGRDEVLCPVDYATAGFINDDYMHANFVSKVPKDVSLFCLMDCCHSGTILDLPYLYGTALAQNNTHATSANVTSISGCRDNQTSADAYIVNDYEGAMTWSFINALKNADYDIKTSDLVKAMRALLAGSYTQVPMLSVSAPGDIDKPFVGTSAEVGVESETPAPATVPITFTMTTDYWYYESSWNVFSVANNANVFEVDQRFKDRYQTTKTIANLVPGSYKLRVKDTYGDGGVRSLVQNGATTLVNQSMVSGTYAEYDFTI